jgi:hypothetical protein
MEANMLSRLHLASTYVIAAVAFFVVMTLSPPEARAHPTQCRMTTYYSDAAMSDIVGVRTNCPGGGSWGRVTRYRETEIVQLGGERPGTGGNGPGSLPCEFLASGCSNLPVARHS